jgi:hypothetical protein
LPRLELRLFGRGLALVAGLPCLERRLLGGGTGLRACLLDLCLGLARLPFGRGAGLGASALDRLRCLFGGGAALRPRLLDLRFGLACSPLGGGAALGPRALDLLFGVARGLFGGGAARGARLFDLLRCLFGGGAGFGARLLYLLFGLACGLLGGVAALGAGLLGGDLGVAGGLLGLLAQRGQLLLARRDGGDELRARGLLGGDALVQAPARNGDLLACAPGVLLGLAARPFECGDALGQLARLTLAAANCQLGLAADTGELVARRAGRPFGVAARRALGLQARGETRHRLPPFLRRALGGLAAAALVAQQRRIDGGRALTSGCRPWRRHGHWNRHACRCSRHLGLAPAAARGLRLRLGRGRGLGFRRWHAARAHGRVLWARQVDDAVRRLEGERQAPVLELRGRHRERRAPRRRVGAGERRGVVGPRQRRQAARAASVVEQQHRRRQPLARLCPPAPGDPQQDRARAGDDALEALDFELRGDAQVGSQSRSARASKASARTCSGGAAPSSTRMRCGSPAASAS